MTGALRPIANSGGENKHLAIFLNQHGVTIAVYKFIQLYCRRYSASTGMFTTILCFTLYPKNTVYASNPDEASKHQAKVTQSSSAFLTSRSNVKQC